MSTALEAEAAAQSGDKKSLESLLAQAEAAGHAQTAMEKLRSHAEFLQRVAQIAQIDVDAEVKYVHDHLPDLRRERGEMEKKKAEKLVNDPARRQAGLTHAANLDRQAKELSAPDVDEPLKARALATELSIRLSAKLRNVRFSAPDVEPSSLRLFERTFQDNTSGVVSVTGVSKAEAQHAARLAFLQAMVETDVTPDDPGGLRAAIVQYRKNTTKDFGPEPGHIHDLPITGNEAAIPLKIEDVATRLESREETRQAVEIARLSKALTIAAAAELNPRHYAVYLVMAENTHLFDWRINDHGKLLFQKREGAEIGDNIAQEVMRNVGGFSGRGAAYRAVHDTLDRLGEAFQKYGRDVAIEDVPHERRVQVLDRITSSREQVVEAARNQRVPNGKNRTRPDTRKQEGPILEDNELE